MTLRLTPATIIAAYDYLKTTSPFNKWKLPDADDLEFRVTRHGDRFGHFDDKDGKSPYLDVSISEVFVKTTKDLLEVMAHEAVHVAMHSAKDPSWERHGKEFKRRARLVCRSHGFDPQSF